MKYIALNSVRIDGKHYNAGDVAELDSLSSIMSNDFKLLEVKQVTKSNQTKVHVNPEPLFRVGLFVTGRCNMNCAHCSQKEFRADHGDMELATVEKICDAVKSSGCEMVFGVTGGEPTLWPHLYDAMKLAKASGCFSQSWLYSNGTDCGQIDILITDGLLTRYNTNAANCRAECHELKKKFPQNVNISTGGHFPLVKKAQWNAIPAECNCPGVAVIGDRVWPCANFYSIIKRHHFDYEQYKKEWSRSVDEDWISFFAENETKKYNSRICMFCEANRKCQREIAPDEKVRRYSSGI